MRLKFESKLNTIHSMQRQLDSEKMFLNAELDTSKENLLITNDKLHEKEVLIGLLKADKQEKQTKIY